MARVTVEDCVQKVPNRFQLVLLAAQRARNLSRGEELTVDRDNDKNPVVALREIADETIELGRIEQDLIRSLSRAPEPEPADEEVLELMMTDQELRGLQDYKYDEEAAYPALANPALIRQFKLTEKIHAYDTRADTKLIDAAYVMAMQAHGNQRRD